MQDVQSAQVVGEDRERMYAGGREREREELQETISQFFHRLGKESRAAIRTSKAGCERGITRAREPVTTDDAHEGLSTRRAIYSLPPPPPARSQSRQRIKVA